ncbi:carbohydrate kinase family protein [Candidatus Nomurabacteria bacterium]|nr:carbohydrate kinase family protein [Candidatus Nomurabacteria bacterium]
MNFFAVGDIVTDAFIRLKDARVHCRLDNEDCEISMKWGDKIPYELHEIVPAVGNAANAAVSAARLGVSSGLRAYVGKDAYGAQCIEVLRREGVDVAYMETQPGKFTNYHYVLWYESQRTILVKHETFDYAVPSLREKPQWLYLSSLGDSSLPYHRALMQMLEKYPDTKLAFQPGTYQMKMGKEALAEVYKRSDLFFCNKEEAERILGLPAGQEFKQLLDAMHALGPKTVVITDGTNGCYARDEQGAMFHLPRYPDPKQPYEVTGAGDALASTTTVALSLGKTLEEALRWGSVNASSVLQGIGAQKGLLTREQLEKNLANPPAPWSVESL